ncbi:MAG: 5'-methylthioadenosine/adenosylhomocysteine nucleosidase [Spirochaetaceae bacterium]
MSTDQESTGRVSQPVLLLGAMDGEISAFLDRLDSAREEPWKGYPVYTGRFAGREVIVARSGVGKSLSAMVAQRLIDRYDPGSILFTGVAGAINPVFEIGDMIVAEETLQYDMDVRALGFQLGEIPYTDHRIITCDPELVRRAAATELPEGTVRIGRILTGDRFVNRRAYQEMGYLRSELQGDAVEMEGASVALVARVNEIPAVVVRTISDKADTNARVDFERFLPRASENSALVVTEILRRK